MGALGLVLLLSAAISKIKRGPEVITRFEMQGSIGIAFHSFVIGETLL